MAGSSLNLVTEKTPSGSSCQERPQNFEPDWIRLSWGHENLYKWESLCLLSRFME